MHVIIKQEHYSLVSKEMRSNPQGHPREGVSYPFNRSYLEGMIIDNIINTPTGTKVGFEPTIRVLKAVHATYSLGARTLSHFLVRQ